MRPALVVLLLGACYFVGCSAYDAYQGGDEEATGDEDVAADEEDETRRGHPMCIKKITKLYPCPHPGSRPHPRPWPHPSPAIRPITCPRPIHRPCPRPVCPGCPSCANKCPGGFIEHRSDGRYCCRDRYEKVCTKISHHKHNDEDVAADEVADVVADEDEEDAQDELGDEVADEFSADEDVTDEMRPTYPRLCRGGRMYRRRERLYVCRVSKHGRRRCWKVVVGGGRHHGRWRDEEDEDVQSDDNNDVANDEDDLGDEVADEFSDDEEVTDEMRPTYTRLCRGGRLYRRRDRLYVCRVSKQGRRCWRVRVFSPRKRVFDETELDEEDANNDLDNAENDDDDLGDEVADEFSADEEVTDELRPTYPRLCRQGRLYRRRTIVYFCRGHHHRRRCYRVRQRGGHGKRYDEDEDLEERRQCPGGRIIRRGGIRYCCRRGRCHRI